MLALAVQVLLGAGMVLVGWWLWVDEDLVFREGEAPAEPIHSTTVWLGGGLALQTGTAKGERH
jgi:hypothetical protein